LSWLAECCRLVRSFVIAGGAAGFAVHQTVLANANVERGLAEAAIFVALTLGFGHFTLCAAVFSLAGSGGHRRNVSARRLDGERAVGNVDACRAVHATVRFRQSTTLPVGKLKPYLESDREELELDR